MCMLRRDESAELCNLYSSGGNGKGLFNQMLRAVMNTACGGIVTPQQVPWSLLAKAC